MTLSLKRIPWLVAAAFVSAGNVAQGRDGSLDRTFGSAGIARTAVGDGGEAYAVALQGNGRIILAGAANVEPFELGVVVLVRYLSGGGLDPSFGEGGVVVTRLGELQEATAHGVIVQPDGKVIAAGWAEKGIDSDQFAVFRYEQNGDLDATFGNGGVALTPVNDDARANALALQADGNIVLAGWTETGQDRIGIGLIRYDAGGVLDSSFGGGGIVSTQVGRRSEAFAVAVQPDGKIVVAGTADVDPIDESESVLVARYLPDGELDAAFGSGGIVVTSMEDRRDGVANALLIQPDGKLVVAGYLERNEDNDDFTLVRYDEGGSLDASFGDGGVVAISMGELIDASAQAVVLQPDGKLLAAGFAETEEDEDDDLVAIVRVDATGDLDPGFGTEGIVRTRVRDSARAYAAVLYGEDRLVVAGGAEVGEFEEDFFASRYSLVPGLCVCDCDGDERVTVSELVTAVNVALKLAGSGACPNADADGDGRISVDELISGVNAGLHGC